MKRKKILESVLFLMIGITFFGGVIGFCKEYNNSKLKDSKIKRLTLYYNILERWLELKQRGGNLETYFLKNGYSNIAIYGMGVLGIRLCDELCNTDIHVAYAVDKDVYGGHSLNLGIDVKLPDELLDDVDVMVVTPLFAFEQIKEELSLKLECPIISLDDIL